MPSNRFWRLIAELGGSNSNASYTRLSMRLAALPVDQLVGFDARLTLSLYALDDECRADWYVKHEPVTPEFRTDDDFLYERADTVTAGRAVWEYAVRTDTLPWGATDAVDRDGENLLYVAAEAANRRGVSDDAFGARESAAFSLSYETGSNPAGWPPDQQ